MNDLDILSMDGARTHTMNRKPFWQTHALSDMTPAQWEALCDGCGRCCLQKLHNQKTGKVYYTAVACYLLDIEQCRCRAYARRFRLVKGCLPLTPRRVERFQWLPRTCAYRLLLHGKQLPAWHPLVTKDPQSVHRAGISVRHRVISEERIHPDDIEAYIVRDLG